MQIYHQCKNTSFHGIMLLQRIISFSLNLCMSHSFWNWPFACKKTWPSLARERLSSCRKGSNCCCCRFVECGRNCINTEWAATSITKKVRMRERVSKERANSFGKACGMYALKSVLCEGGERYFDVSQLFRFFCAPGIVCAHKCLFSCMIVANDWSF